MSGSEKRVRAPFVVVGLMFAALGAVGAWVWGESAGDTTAVVVAEKPLAAGSRISGDLSKTFRSVEVSVGELADGMVLYKDVESLEGLRVRGFVPEDSIVPRAALSTQTDDGGATLGIRVKEGDFLPDITEGDVVNVFGRSGDLGPGDPIATGVVVASVQPSKQGDTTVSLRVLGPDRSQVEATVGKILNANAEGIVLWSDSGDR